MTIKFYNNRDNQYEQARVFGKQTRKERKEKNEGKEMTQLP